jgi:uncharacterized protein (TIGR01244 family)
MYIDMRKDARMRSIAITDTFSVAGQPNVADFKHLAGEGFHALINARPDGEEADQPGNVAEQRAAHDVGLRYSFVPVTGATITRADIDAFRSALADSTGPVVAHCKSGARALTLYVLGEVLDGRMKVEDVVSFGKSRGFDLSGAVKWLERTDRERPRVRGFFDPRTYSIQYVVADPVTKRCAIIDPVLDFDEKSGATATRSADAILAYVDDNGLSIEWILDTHPHADHFSAAHYLREKTGAPTAIGARVVDIQKLWQGIYNWPSAQDGSQWDRLFADGDRFKIGSIDANVMLSAGHTLASVTYVIGDAAFVHDTLFMPDSGTARADFPGGDAHILWRSMQDILALPDETRIFTGHDYQPEGRTPRWESTVGEQKRANPHVAGLDEAAFAKLREARDRTLPMPKLILQALQVNLRGGRLPEPEDNGRRYLKFPLDALQGAAW